MNFFLEQAAKSWQSIVIIMALISAIIHVIFAGAVAKDAGKITRAGVSTQLVSPVVWAFATLAGGVVIAAIYWCIHHVNFSRVMYPRPKN